MPKVIDIDEIQISLIVRMEMDRGRRYRFSHT